MPGFMGLGRHHERRRRVEVRERLRRFVLRIESLEGRQLLAADAPLVPGTLLVNNPTFQEGITVAGPIATFSDSDPAAQPGDFAATIDWGDGTAAKPDITVGVVTQPGGAGMPFNVAPATSAPHLYNDEGVFTVKVMIVDLQGRNDPGGSTATVTG